MKTTKKRTPFTNTKKNIPIYIKSTKGNSLEKTKNVWRGGGDMETIKRNIYIYTFYSYLII